MAEERQREAALRIRRAAEELESAMNAAEAVGVIVGINVQSYGVTSVVEDDDTTRHTIRVATTVKI